MEGKSKRSQGSLEFLMTYGWAVVAALVGLAALWILVGSPNRLLADLCLLTPPLHCEDAVASSTTNTLTLFIRNSILEDITIRAIDLPNAGCQSDLTVLIPGGEARFLTVPCPPLSDNRLHSDLFLLYEVHRRDGIRVPRTGRGELVITYEAPPQPPEGEASQQTLCQNAQTGNLCPGLNILFGPGYQEDCCSLYTLCCG